ncbi:MAG: sigma-70 family RNA polymerase sigma factor [Nitriliruptoraceae bacterium]
MAPPDRPLRTGDLATASDEDVLAVFADVERDPSVRQTAFHLLVTRHQRRVFAVCARLLDTSHDAEEATQEVFIRLARGASGFRGDARLSTWLFRVAHNVCTDRIRHDARRPSTPVGDVIEAAGDRPGDDETAASDTADALRTALATLDEQSRTVLLLIAVDGLSYDEVAALVGLPVGTVKSRVSRARVRLGRLLAAPTGSTAPLGPGHDDPADESRPATTPIRGPPGP